MKLAPCHCGHPGSGCSCYDIRLARALSAEALLERVTTTPESSTQVLVRQLRELREVWSVDVEHYHGHVRVNVHLNDWNWDAMAQPSELIDAYARGHVQHFSVTTRFHPPNLAPPPEPS